MNATDPKAAPNEERSALGTRRCTAHNRAGTRCEAPAIRGATVCRSHGGNAPQVRAAARLRLAELVDPAIATLARLIADPATSDAVRLRAAENVLDRAGYPRAATVDLDGAREVLRARLAEVAALPDVVDAVVVDEVDDDG